MVKSSTSIRSSLRPHKSECGPGCRCNKRVELHQQLQKMAGTTAGGPGCRCHRIVETDEQSAELQQRGDLIENFPVRVLGLEEEVAKRDAYRLRYVLSARTVQKMTAYCRQLSENGNNTRS